MSILSTSLHYDCDPGQDDAIALLYALGSSGIDVRSISVVGGNVDVYQCARNALQILDLAGRPDIPVYLGAEKPLKRKLQSLPEVFGVTGMAGAEDLPIPSAKHQALRDLSTLSKQSVLVATGPLTNLALAIQDNPEFPKQVSHLYVMGGCPFPEPLRGLMGNYKPAEADDYAEYNFAVDPEAAKIVFSAGFNAITLVGLNVTRSVLYNQEIDDKLRAIGTEVAKKAADILSAVGDDDISDYEALRKTPSDPVRAMHDVVAMASIDAPDIFEYDTVPLRIVIGVPPAPCGQSLIDFDEYDHPRVRVVKSIDCQKFVRVFLENIARL